MSVRWGKSKRINRQKEASPAKKTKLEVDMPGVEPESLAITADDVHELTLRI